MLISLLYLILSLISIQSYFKRQYKRFIILLSIIIYHGFGFIPLILADEINTYNFIVIIIISILCLSKQNLLSIKKDIIGKTIVWILAYQFTNTLFSGFTGVDSWFNVVGQYRYYLILLFYFIFRPIPPKCYQNLIPSFLKLIIIVIVLYISFSFLKIPNNHFKNSVFIFAPILLYYILFEKVSLELHSYRKFIILALVIGIVFLLARILLLAIILSLIIYLFKFTSIKKSLLPAIVILLITPIMINILDSRKMDNSDSNNLATELKIINETSDYSQYKASSGALRFVSIWERIEYMVNHPFNLVFGIGNMKEITAQEKLSFISGTNGILEDNGKIVTLQLDTDDIGLLSNFMRFGLIYIILFFFLCKQAFKRFKIQFHYLFSKTSYLTLLMMLLAIPGTSLFFSDWTLFPFLILLGISGYYFLITNKKYGSL